ncbi:response regulator transcription factor (plasmid) [Alicyclobacillus fastidiosus]|uniref:Response regulator transcription factor n=1 Tax=Alicyclobacillus fastidiosus TaxID=392011 RepID=A0ABY6ZQ17_9BACL|nr:response regulator transcription factor [Alicyclobacillus fastidiosus]WAH44950.1 response regulator transcription factor [Alicyclobacillus fastidiosus]GMA65602.1 DNA-binding response regulator [Alicyclobacillus fastidiosus]GMA65718.1 DNA-binding response regulator [Alicyclobacillus fastidiosus]
MNRAEAVKVLVVDDEIGMLEFLELGLEEEGYQVMTAQDGPSALSIANTFNPHIVILDVMMPGMDGFEVCAMLKKRMNCSVIMLTAKDDVKDRVLGLSIGADDYVGKPFSFQELLARIQARVRNQFSHLLDEFVIGDFSINDLRKEISYQGSALSLSTTEYELLKYLLINHDIVLSKAKILEVVWGYDFSGQNNIVEVYISIIRDKLGDKNHDIIRTVRGAGYRIDL